MDKTLNLGIIQHNPTVGDVVGNVNQIERRFQDLTADGADLVVGPELSVLGYPPRDLLHRTGMLNPQWSAIEQLAGRLATGPPLIIGASIPKDTESDALLQNGAVVLRDGKVATTYAKRLLPTYDVFDEHRYFQPGAEPVTLTINGFTVGLSICEDAWHNVKVAGQRQHDTNPLAELADIGTDAIVTLSASPFSLNKNARRKRRFANHATQTDCPVAFVNQVGGNDELIFDGHSFVVNASGDIFCRLSGFSTDATVVSLPVDGAGSDTSVVSGAQSNNKALEARQAIRLGVVDYFNKVGFNEAIVGMSGGIDSSVMTAVAVDALGADSVYGVSLPSTVTSDESVTDAQAVADSLGIKFDIIPINNIINTVRSEVDTYTRLSLTGVAAENIQARVRGSVLMGLANQRDALVLTPDNKSEAAVGYCTLYGDTVGALAPLGDCYKGLVYDLAAQYNDDPPDSATGSVIPGRIIEKQPSAELREGQTDTDELPPYDRLDSLLEGYISRGSTTQQLHDKFPTEVVKDVIQRVAGAEFKRRQTPPPLRITQKALGRGWNYPVAAEYRHVASEN
jgi:NAD+ synthase/NAD+ synthase (glutamine-hydrolysing)